MRIYTKYRGVRRRRKPRARARWWLMVLVVLGGMAWLGWHYRAWWWRPHRNPLAAGHRTFERSGAERSARERAKTSAEFSRTNQESRAPAVRQPASSGVLHSPAVPTASSNAPTSLAGETNPPPAQAHEPRSLLEAQVELVRQGISPGPIDGVWGSQTRSALRALQRKCHLAATGDLNSATRAQLMLSDPAETTYEVSPADLARLHRVGKTWLEKSQQLRLEYETVLELVAERGQAKEALIRAMNPDLDWDHIQAGAVVRLPNAAFPPVRARAAFIKISLSEKTLEAFDARTNLLAHFPCSIARRVEKRPVGRLAVETIAFNPNYRFDPAIFPESEEGRRLGRRLIIPPGPNNPVGTAWIGLNRPGYGIHGTPLPEQVGRTESHGCFRLANWCADYLAKLVQAGTAVLVEP